MTVAEMHAVAPAFRVQEARKDGSTRILRDSVSPNWPLEA